MTRHSPPQTCCSNPRRAGQCRKVKFLFHDKAAQFVLRNNVSLACGPGREIGIVLWPCITSGIYVLAADLHALFCLELQGVSSRRALTAPNATLQVRCHSDRSNNDSAYAVSRCNI